MPRGLWPSSFYSPVSSARSTNLGTRQRLLALFMSLVVVIFLAYAVRYIAVVARPVVCTFIWLNLNIDAKLLGSAWLAVGLLLYFVMQRRKRNAFR